MAAATAEVAGYTGYRIEGAEPGVHRGLPSRHLTFIVTLDGMVDLTAMPDPAQPPGSFSTLASGLHAIPVLISHGSPGNAKDRRRSSGGPGGGSPPATARSGWRRWPRKSAGVGGISVSASVASSV
ncbi:MAG: hypothetical protein ACRDSP_15695 [Pseudonocardiaceae bacterium]